MGISKKTRVRKQFQIDFGDGKRVCDCPLEVGRCFCIERKEPDLNKEQGQISDSGLLCGFCEKRDSKNIQYCCKN